MAKLYCQIVDGWMCVSRFKESVSFYGKFVACGFMKGHIKGNDFVDLIYYCV